MQKVLDLDETQYLVAFEIANYVLKISKFQNLIFVQFFSTFKNFFCQIFCSKFL